MINFPINDILNAKDPSLSKFKRYAFHMDLKLHELKTGVTINYNLPSNGGPANRGITIMADNYGKVKISAMSFHLIKQYPRFNLDLQGADVKVSAVLNVERNRLVVRVNKMVIGVFRLRYDTTQSMIPFNVRLSTGSNNGTIKESFYIDNLRMIGIGLK